MAVVQVDASKRRLGIWDQGGDNLTIAFGSVVASPPDVAFPIFLPVALHGTTGRLKDGQGNVELLDRLWNAPFSAPASQGKVRAGARVSGLPNTGLRSVTIIVQLHAP